MNAFQRPLGRLILVLAAIAYCGILCIALIVFHLAPEIILAMTVCGAALMMMSVRPYVGVHVFIMMLFVEDVLGGGEGFTPMKVIGATILAGWLLNVAMQPRFGLKFDGFTAVLVAFVLWSGISMLYALDTGLALARTFQYAEFALATLMFSAVVNTPNRIRGAYWSFTICATLSTIVAIAMYYLRMTPTASGLVSNRNILATYINIAIACAYLLYKNARPVPGRVSLMMMLPVLFLGIGLTFSRGGLISLVVILLIVWYRVAKQKGFLLLLGSASMLAVLTAALPSDFWDRAETIVPAIEHNTDTFGARVRLWKVAARMIEKSPIVGVGPGNFAKAFPHYARGNDYQLLKLSTHNAYVGVTAENGVIGGILFVLIIGLALRASRQGLVVGRAVGRTDLETHGIAAEVSLFALAIAGLTGDVVNLKCLWMFFGLGVAMQRMTEPASAMNQGVEKVENVPVEGVVPWAVARDRQ